MYERACCLTAHRQAHRDLGVCSLAAEVPALWPRDGLLGAALRALHSVHAARPRLALFGRRVLPRAQVPVPARTHIEEQAWGTRLSGDARTATHAGQMQTRVVDVNALSLSLVGVKGASPRVSPAPPFMHSHTPLHVTYPHERTHTGESSTRKNTRIIS